MSAKLGMGLATFVGGAVAGFYANQVRQAELNELTMRVNSLTTAMETNQTENNRRIDALSKAGIVQAGITHTLCTQTFWSKDLKEAEQVLEVGAKQLKAAGGPDLKEWFMQITGQVGQEKQQ